MVGRAEDLVAIKLDDVGRPLNLQDESLSFESRQGM